MLAVRQCLLTLCFAAAGLAGDQAVPAPTALPDDQAFLVAIIPDLRATLAHAEQIAESFNPGQLKPGALVAQIGAALGDPGLGNFAGKPIMIAVGPGAPTPSFALLLPGKDAQLYVDAAAQRGLIMGTVVEGLAVVAQTPDGQKLGERVAAAYAALSAGAGTRDLRLLVAPDRVVAAYGPFIANLVQMGAKNLPQQPGGPDLGKVLTLETAGLLAVLGELAAVQVDLDLANGMVGIDQLLAAKPGSALAKALVAPAPAAGKPVASRLGAESNVMAFSGRMNIQALVGYAIDVLDRLQQQPAAKDMITPELIAQLRSLPLPWTGDFATRLISTPQAPLLIEAVYGAIDQAQAQSAVDHVMGLFTGDGAFATFYRSMGIGITATKAVRSVGGVSVQRLSTVLDAAKLPPDQVEAMKAMMRDYELAVLKDCVVMTQDPKALDALVGGQGAGLVNRGEKALGAGHQSYIDVDLVGLMRAQTRMAGDKVPDSVRQVFEQLVPGEPVIGAFDAADGRAHVQYRVPLAPFVDMSKAFRKQPKQAQPKQPAPDAGNGF